MDFSGNGNLDLLEIPDEEWYVPNGPSESSFITNANQLRANSGLGFFQTKNTNETKILAKSGRMGGIWRKISIKKLMKTIMNPSYHLRKQAEASAELYTRRDLSVFPHALDIMIAIGKMQEDPV